MMIMITIIIIIFIGVAVAVANIKSQHQAPRMGQVDRKIAVEGEI